MSTKPEVLRELNAKLLAQEDIHRQKRLEHQEIMSRKRDSALARMQMKEANLALKKAKEMHSKATAAVAAMEKAKAFTLEQLGFGKPNGGLKDHHKNRMAALDHMRRVATLSPVQVDHWDVFNEIWDAKMVEIHKDK